MNLLGGNSDSLKDSVIIGDAILEYDVTADAFTQIGTMTQAREGHAVSVVQYQEFSKWCQFDFAV